MISKGITAVLVIVSLVVGFGLGAFVYAPLVTPPTTTTNVKMIVDWVMNGEFAPYSSAITQGYYAQQGLAVTLLPSGGGGDALKKLAAGSADFGRASVDVLEQAFAKDPTIGVKLVLLQEHSDITSICYVQGTIAKPSDLNGKKIAVPPGSSEDVFSTPLLQAFGVDPSKVTLVHVSFGAELAAVASGQVDAGLCYAADTPIYQSVADSYHKTMAYFAAADYGWKALGLGVMTTSSEMKSHPDVVKRFLAATIQGEIYALQHPSDAINQMITLYPSLNATTELQTWQIYGKFYINAGVKANGLGYLSTDDLAADIALTKSALGITTAIQTTDVYDSSFLASPLPAAPSLSIAAVLVTALSFYPVPSSKNHPTDQDSSARPASKFVDHSQT